MAQHDSLVVSIQRCIDNPTFNALQAISLLERSAVVIKHLQTIIREYNSDDALFDDEKT